MDITLNQLEATHRQLVTAISMYFADGDPVAIHTLASASREIYEKSCEKAGIDRMFNHIRAVHQQPDNKLWNILNGARNFFKHPSESLDDKIELRDSDNKAMIFIACHDCAMLCGTNQPLEVQVFSIWFMATEFPSDASSEDKNEALQILTRLDLCCPGLRSASPAEQKRQGHLFLEATLRDPSLSKIGITARIAESERLIEWFDRKIDGLAIPSTLRSRLSCGCLDMAMEHQKAIVILTANRLNGSAFALLRLLFEAYVRGAWLHQCASDEDLTRFSNDKLDKKFGSFITDLEKLDGFNSGVLLKAKAASWNRMNDLTHTGPQQVIRRNTATTIEADYSEAEILEAIGFADAIASLSVIEIAHLAGNNILANEILQEVKNRFQPNNSAHTP